MMRKGDPADLFMGRYRFEMPHASLGRDGEESSVEMPVRKMPPRGKTMVN